MILPPGIEMPPRAPVTVECMVEAAEYHQVPMAILAAVMRQEDGRVGKKSPNKNGSYDHGPMQVNTLWLDELAAQGVSYGLLMNNGCANVYAGAWILRQSMDDAAGNPWIAVGYYHTGAPRADWPSYKWDHWKGYVINVMTRVANGIRIDELVSRVNGGVTETTPMLAMKQE